MGGEPGAKHAAGCGTMRRSCQCRRACAVLMWMFVATGAAVLLVGPTAITGGRACSLFHL